MTTQMIDTDTMQAGREMDALIQWHVMQGGKPSDPYNPAHAYIVNGDPRVWCKASTPHYSTDIAEAWLVVEQMLSNDRYGFQLYTVAPTVFWAVFTKRSTCHDYESGNAPAALAICRAALKALAAAGGV